MTPGEPQQAEAFQCNANDMPASRELAVALSSVRVTLHMVRHFAAWRYLKEHPGHYEDVRRLLGHRNLATTTAYYIAFETEAVAARFDGMILKEKRETRLVAAAVLRQAAAGAAVNARVDPSRRCLPVSEWSENDRKAWEVAKDPSLWGRVVRRSPAAGLRSATIEKYEV
jgi:hypothetical protein